MTTYGGIHEPQEMVIRRVPKVEAHRVRPRRVWCSICDEALRMVVPSTPRRPFTPDPGSSNARSSGRLVEGALEYLI
jgi:hypothetical protein